MKKAVQRWISIFAALLIGAVCLFPVAAAEKEKTVKIGFYSLPGFQTVGAHGILSGYMYDYLKEIAKQTGWNYEYYTGSLSECLSKLEAGEIDFVGGLQSTPERRENFLFPQYSCGAMYVGLYVKNSDATYAYGDTESFHGMTVGVLRGLAGNQDLIDYCQTNGFSIHTKEYAEQQELEQALEQGKVDAICMLSANKQEDYRCIAGFGYKDFYLMAAPGRQELVRQLDRALETIKVQAPFYEQNLWNRYFPSTQSTVPVFTKEELAYIQNAGVINVVYNKSWVPMERYNDKTGEFDGVNAEVFAQISRLTGLVFHYIPEESNAKAYELVQQDYVQMMSSTPNDYTWAEQHGMLLSHEYLNIPVVMVSGLEDSRGMDDAVIAVSQEVYLTEQLQESFPDYTYVEYENFADCFEAVRTGQATATFVNAHLAREYLKEAKYSSLNVITMNGFNVRYCVGFPMDADRLLISVIDKALACISDDQINDFIVADTIKYKQFSLIDLVSQRPVESVLILVSTFAVFIILLLVILRNRTRFAQKLYTLVNLDALTGGPSFSKFQHDANQLIRDDRHAPYLLVYLNIAKFKSINDLYGYATGDKLLKCVSKCIAKYLSPNELYARVHSDRFVVLLQDQGEKEFCTRYAAFKEGFRSSNQKDCLPGKILFTTGLCVLGETEHDLNVVIDRASYAANQCYSEMSAEYVYYDETLKRKIETEQRLESDMEKALRDGQFKVFYQPKINSETGILKGAEALIRWDYPGEGIVSPGVFIPLFEKNRFILQIDRFVFSEVCRYLAQRKQQGKPLFPISCNFSRLHFMKESFPEELEQVAKEYGVSCSLLEIEITETMAVSEISLIRGQLDRLRAKGFPIAIDDFGSGYSSLGILTQIPFDVVKLDRSLILNATKDDSNRKLLAGMISVIQALQKDIVCEGVEEKEQIELLKALHCYVIQGYYYAKPMPQEAFDAAYSQGE